MKRRKEFCGSNGEPNSQGNVNHILLVRYNFGAPGEPPQMMADIAVVVFNVYRVRFPDNMAFGWQNFGKGIPIIRVKCTFSKMFYFII